ncbi:myosin-8-like [Camellia sinensis]|uniref:myosin-8-like n=1 Tax=Camellia sinensis TaxID=4442 RepID=UPI00103687E5|nr:myosin-8-like [Camellia sinensis]
MVGESLMQLERRKNAERMAARRRAETIRSEPTAMIESSLPVIAEEMAQIEMAETVQPVERLSQRNDPRGEKRPAESEVDYEEIPTDKRPCIKESDSVVDERPRIEESDSVVAFVTAGRISEIGRRQHDAIEQIGFLKTEIESEKDKAAEAAQRAEHEATRAAEESVRADAVAEKERSFDRLRLAAEEKANAIEDALKLAKEVIAKMEADLEESKKGKEKANSKISKAFQVGNDATLENYVEEVPKQIGLEASDSEQAEEPVAEEVAEQPSQSALEAEEVDEALNLAFEEAGLNPSNLPSTSGRGDVTFGDIFTDLGDLPGLYPENMVGESLMQLERRKNAERMAARRRAETIRSKPTATIESSLPVIAEEMAQIEMAETEQPVERLSQRNDPRREKRPAESEVDYEEIPTDKRPCIKESDSVVDERPRIEESDSVVAFVVQPRIKNVSISSDASALKDPTVALSMASPISLSTDRETFRTEPDLLAIALALAAQSAILEHDLILTAGRISEIGRRQHDAIEQISFLKTEIESEKGKAAEAAQRAEHEATRAAEESVRADAEAEKERSSDRLRLAAEERANAIEDALKLAKEVIAKMEADLEESKKGKEKANSEISKAFQVGNDATLENYVEEVSKFKNQDFKHSWLKSLDFNKRSFSKSIINIYAGFTPS